MTGKWAIVCCALFGLMPVQAATLQLSHSQLQLSASSNVTGSDLKQVGTSAQLGLFDPSLGVLNSYTLILSTDAFDLTGASSYFGGNARLDHNASAFIEWAIPGLQPSARVAMLSDNETCTAPPSCNITLSASGNNQPFLVGPESSQPSLDALTGLGSFDLNYSLTLVKNTSLAPRILPGIFGQPNSYAGSASSNWRGSAAIIYDFEPVSAIPLPAAIWLFASAVFGLFCWRRRN